MEPSDLGEGELGRVLPLRPDDDEPSPEPAPTEETLFSAGDEPDVEYDVKETAPRPVLPARPPAVVPEPVAGSVLAYAKPAPQPLFAATDGPEADYARWDEWDGSVVAGLYAPAAILLVSFVMTFVAVGAYSPSYHGRKWAMTYVVLEGTLRIGTLLATAWAGVKLLEMTLGRIVPAALKLSAIAVTPGALVGLLLIIAGISGRTLDDAWLDPLKPGSLGGLVAAVLSLASYFALFYLLFDLPQDKETWLFIFVLWMIQFFVAGLVAHLILDPPAVTPPYVAPKNPLRFTIGS